MIAFNPKWNGGGVGGGNLKYARDIAEFIDPPKRSDTKSLEGMTPTEAVGREVLLPQLWRQMGLELKKQVNESDSNVWVTTDTRVFTNVPEHAGKLAALKL